MGCHQDAFFAGAATDGGPAAGTAPPTVERGKPAFAGGRKGGPMSDEEVLAFEGVAPLNSKEGVLAYISKSLQV